MVDAQESVAGAQLCSCQPGGVPGLSLSTEKEDRLIVESPKSNHSHTQMTANLLPNPESFLISPYNA